MCRCSPSPLYFFFFFNDTATTEIYTLSLHDALPISSGRWGDGPDPWGNRACGRPAGRDRKSTRLNSSHTVISYAVFCLKKKKASHKSSERSTYKSYRMPSSVEGVERKLL